MIDRRSHKNLRHLEHNSDFSPSQRSFNATTLGIETRLGDAHITAATYLLYFPYRRMLHQDENSTQCEYMPQDRLDRNL